MKSSIVITFFLIIWATNAWSLVSQKQQYEVVWPVSACSDPYTALDISEWTVEVKLNGTTFLTNWVRGQFDVSVATLAGKTKMFVTFNLSNWPSDINANDQLEVSVKWSPGCGGGPYTTKKTYIAGKTSSDKNVYYVTNLKGDVRNEGLILEGPAAPEPSISVSNQTICQGATGKTFTATVANAGSGYTISWVNASWSAEPKLTASGTADRVNIGAFTKAGGSPYTLHAILKDNGGTALDTADFTLTVNKPDITLSKNPNVAKVCPGVKTTLTAAGGAANKYKWIIGTAAPGAYAAGSKDVYPTAKTDYKVIGEDANGCLDTSAVVSVDVFTRPKTLVVNNPTSKSCGGTAIVLTATGGANTYNGYKWIANASGTANPLTVAPLAKTTYKVEAKDANNCLDTASIDVDVFPKPDIAATATPATVANGTEKSQLNVDNKAGNAATGLTWTWSPSGKLENGAADVSVKNPKTSFLSAKTTYTVIAKSDQNCLDTTTVDVNVSGGTPGISVNPVTICAGDKGPIRATVTGPAGYKIKWYNNDTPWGIESKLSPTGDNANIGAFAAGTYTLHAVLCTSTDTPLDTADFQLTVNPKPDITATTDKTILIAGVEQAQLGVTVNTGTIASWAWTPAGSVTSASIQNPKTNTLTAKTKFTVIGSTALNCKDTSSVEIDVEVAGPELALALTPVNSCIGEAVPQLVASASGGKGTYTFTWGPAPAGVTLGTQVDDAAAKNSKITITNGAALAAGQYKIPVSVTDGNITKTGEVVVNVDMCVCPGRLTMVAQAKTPCAAPNATNTITITGSSADGTVLYYSFVLKNELGVVVFSKTNDLGPTWTFPILYGNQGTYRLEDFVVRTALGGAPCDGTITTVDIKVDFLPVPTVSAGPDQNLCGLDPITLKGSGTAGVTYKWDNGVTDGLAFPPVVGTTTYTVTGEDANKCSATDQVVVTVNNKPRVTADALPKEICHGNTVVLTPGGDPDLTYTWNNGGQTGIPVAPAVSTRYTVTGTSPVTNCSDTASVFIKVNQLPAIVSTTPANRIKRIAIGKDALFGVEASGENLTYQWWQKDAAGTWNALANTSTGYPQISGVATPELKLIGVPKAWDGSEFKCVVTNPCGFVEAQFSLSVSECFDITGTLAMGVGIMPDEVPGDAIDGWYCIGTRIALHAKIIQEEGYDVENPRYRWFIDGEPAEKVIDTDSSTLSWVPEFWEDDIVVKVCMYSDGACEEYCTKYLRLKARPFEDARVQIQTSVDPELAFCPGEEVDFWVAAKGTGINPTYKWYRDVFELGSGDRKTVKMSQKDTWVKVVMTPSPEVCTSGVIADTVFLKVKETVVPTLRIENNIGDTVACQGDRIGFTAIFSNAGKNPDIHWYKDIWNIGTGSFAEATLLDKDMWIECVLAPGNDVCFDGKALRDTMVIRGLEKASVTIAADMTDKVPGDELLFESEVVNMMNERKYEWFVNANLTPEDRDIYTSTVLKQGDVVVCAVSGEKICQNRVFSNEIEVYYGKASRDTAVEIYRGERISNMNLKKAGDATNLFQIIEKPENGYAVLLPNGLFNYSPYKDFVGVDVVKYKVRNLFDKDKYEEGYIYITVKDNDRFFVPNIITPNGDGLNDSWKLDFLTDYPNHLITVYDRNGKVVFQANNYQNDWDGSGLAKGGYVAHINLVNGIYTYVIDLGDKEKTILKSWLEIRSDMNRRKVR